MNLIPEASAVWIDVQFVMPFGKSLAVTLVSDILALHVVLTTRLPGRFTENSFALQKDRPKTVYFSPRGVFPSAEELKRTLRVEHLLSYM
jgi:hypothetical protein